MTADFPTPDYTPKPSAETPVYTQDENTSSGGGLSVGEGVGIATSLLPLVALFTGKQKSKPTPQKISLQQRQMQSPSHMSERTKMLLVGGAAVAILGIGILALSKN